MKILDPDDSKHPVNAEHQAPGLPPLEREVTAAAEHPELLLMAGCIVYRASVWFNRPESLGLARPVLHSEAFWWAVAAGLLATTSARSSSCGCDCRASPAPAWAPGC